MNQVIRDVIVALCITLSGALAVPRYGAAASPSPSMGRRAEGCTGDICVTQRALAAALSTTFVWSAPPPFHRGAASDCEATIT
jgi:hypothetical protein